jgi:hypothetical protein
MDNERPKRKKRDLDDERYDKLLDKQMEELRKQQERERNR